MILINRFDDQVAMVVCSELGRMSRMRRGCGITDAVHENWLLSMDLYASLEQNRDFDNHVLYPDALVWCGVHSPPLQHIDVPTPPHPPI